MPENAPGGTLVGITALARDRDGTHNAVVYALSDDAGGRFQIDPVEGVVSLTAGAILDREIAAQFGIVVEARSEDGSSSRQRFEIGILDRNEFAIGPLRDADSVPNEVPEHAPYGTPVGLIAFAVDRDATNSAISYRLTDSAGGRFAIDPSTGIVTVAEPERLNRSEATSWPITVMATSADGTTSTGTWQIGLLGLEATSDGTILDLDSAPNRVDENAPAGTTVGIQAFTRLPDPGAGTVHYSLFLDTGGRFLVDPFSGVVTVRDGGRLDREQAAAYVVGVRAEGPEGFSREQLFSIALNDVDEFDLEFLADADPAPDAVVENSAEGTPVGLQVRALDRDATWSLVRYSLGENPGGRFVIDPLTGVVSVARNAGLDREAASTHSIRIAAESQDGSGATQSFPIALLDANEFAISPLSDSDPGLNRIPENSAPGTPIGLCAHAVDLDATTNEISYFLWDDAGARFQIDPSTGVVTAGQTPLNYETASAFRLRIGASSQDGSSTSFEVSVAIEDVLEDPRIELSHSSVAENQPAGTVVGTLAVVDQTASRPVFSLVSGLGATDNSRFSVSGNLLKTRGPLNFETRSHYSIRVQMKSADGKVLIQVLAIDAVDVNEAPSSVSFLPVKVRRSSPIGVLVGTLGAVDPDRDEVLSYSLVPGSGSTHNARFQIAGNELRLAQSLEHTSSRTLTVRVRVTDHAGLFRDRILEIRVSAG